MSVTGTEEYPAKAGIPAADIGAGMYLFSGILAALYDRERTGEGTTFEVSLFDALSEWMGFPLHYAAGSGTAPVRAGTSHPAIAPYGAFAAGDGQEVVLSIQNEREWQRFCETVLGDAAIAEDERFATNSDRVANRPALDSVIDGVLRDLTGDQFVGRLEEAGIANARRRTLDQVLEHPQHEQRGRFVEVDSSGGPAGLTARTARASSSGRIYSASSTSIPSGRVRAQIRKIAETTTRPMPVQRLTAVPAARASCSGPSSRPRITRMTP